MSPIMTRALATAWVALGVFWSMFAFAQLPQPVPLPPSFSYPPSDVMTVKELFAVMNERDRAINQRFELQDKAVNAALAAAKEAVTAALVAAKEAVAKAEFAAEKRFDAVNEFRATLRDQQSTLASKIEVEVKMKGLDDRLSAITSRLQEVISRQQQEQGKSEGAMWLWVLVGGIVTLLFGAATMFMRYTAWREHKPIGA